MNILGNYLVSKGSSRTSGRAGRHVGRFLEYDHGRSPPTKKYYPKPLIQAFHSWMCKRILGRMRETKVTDTELNWLYSALIAWQPIDPSHLMINWWCCEATSGSGDIGSGCYLSMLAISLRPGITRNPEHFLTGISLAFEYMKQGKYISGDETGGFKVDKVNLPLPDARLRLFIQGKEDWLEEGLLVPARKNKRGRIIEESSSAAQEEGAQQNYVPPYGGILTPPSYYGGAPMQAWGSGAAMPPTKFCGAQCSLCGALCTFCSTATKCDHYWKIRCKEHAKYCSHPNQCSPIG
jgi:hypothetical protein